VSDFFKKEYLKYSEYPSNFIPSAATPFVFVDKAQGRDRCVEIKGFKDENGKFHIQEVKDNEIEER